MSRVDLRTKKSHPGYLIDSTVFELEALYNELIAEGSPEFNEAVVPLFFHEKSSGGDACLAEMEKLVLENKEAAGKLGAIAPIIVSCAYCGEALRALNTGNRDLAWSLIADAQYWYGFAAFNKEASGFIKQVERNARKTTARKAGLARSGKYDPVRAEAYRLAVTLCPKSGWPSFNNAAQVIHKAVHEFSVQVNQEISFSRSITTVSDWLKIMPDADRYFKNMRK